MLYVVCCMLFWGKMWSKCIPARLSLFQDKSVVCKSWHGNGRARPAGHVNTDATISRDVSLQRLSCHAVVVEICLLGSTADQSSAPLACCYLISWLTRTCREWLTLCIWLSYLRHRVGPLVACLMTLKPLKKLRADRLIVCVELEGRVSWLLKRHYFGVRPRGRGRTGVIMESSMWKQLCNRHLILWQIWSSNTSIFYAIGYAYPTCDTMTSVEYDHKNYVSELNKFYASVLYNSPSLWVSEWVNESVSVYFMSTRIIVCLDSLTFENVAFTLLRNVRNRFPSDAVSHPRRTETLVCSCVARVMHFVPTGLSVNFGLARKSATAIIISLISYHTWCDDCSRICVLTETLCYFIHIITDLS